MQRRPREIEVGKVGTMAGKVKTRGEVRQIVGKELVGVKNVFVVK